jgi:hypothetical protein
MGKVSAGTVAAVAVALLVALIPVSSHAADNTAKNLPWEKFSIQGGAFFAAMDDKVTIGPEGAGVAIDLESLLGLKTQNTVFRVGGLYRFGEARRHRMDLEYFYFNRSADKTIGQQITVGDNVIIDAGASVNSTFNLQIVKGTYSYSFFQDDRMDLAASIGLFVMPLKLEITAGAVGKSGSLKFTAPLPVLGLRGDFAITPKWFLRTKFEFFYLEYQNFKGSLMDTNIAVDYNPWKNFGVGLGLENFRMGLKADGSDYPSLNFAGQVKMQYIGAQLYARYFF